MKKLNILIVVIATCCSAGAFAQSAPISAADPSTFSTTTQNYARSVTLTILARADVQNDIGLTSQESASLATLLASVQDSHTLVTTLAQLRTFEAAVSAQVSAILSDQQNKRLKELTIQYLGYESLYSTQMQEEVGLTGTQILQVDVIFNDLLAARAKSSAVSAGQLNAQANQALAAVLTSTQIDKLHTFAAVPLGTP